MANLAFPDDRNDDEADSVLVCTGEDIDFDSSEADAIVEFTQMNFRGYSVSMCPYGFTLNLEEAKELHELLGYAIQQAEQSNGATD